MNTLVKTQMVLKIYMEESLEKTDPSLKIILDGKRLIQTDTVKYLGALLDDRLL